MSKHVGEKCGKLHITYILSSKRGITPSKIDAKWRHSNLICSTLKQSDVENFSSICQSMYEKSVENGRTETRTDGRRVGRTESRTETRTDGHHHTIIRPVWRRAYNKNWNPYIFFQINALMDIKISIIDICYANTAPIPKTLMFSLLHEWKI